MNSERPWGEDDSRRSSLRSTSIYDAEGTGAGMEYVFLRCIFYDNNEVSNDFLSRTIAATNIPHPVIPITDEMITTVNGNSSLFGVVIGNGFLSIDVKNFLLMERPILDDYG